MLEVCCLRSETVFGSGSQFGKKFIGYGPRPCLAPGASFERSLLFTVRDRIWLRDPVWKEVYCLRSGTVFGSGIQFLIDDCYVRSGTVLAPGAGFESVLLFYGPGSRLKKMFLAGLFWIWGSRFWKKNFFIYGPGSYWPWAYFAHWTSRTP